MHPILFKIGSINFLSYTIFAFLAIIFGSLFLVYRFKKYKIKIDYIDFLFWIILFGAIGAKLFYILMYPSQFSLNIFYSGGVVSWGGIILGTIAAIFYFKKHNINILKALDAGFIALLFGLAIGRIGSFLNGDGYGRITSSKIGIIIPKVDDFPRFPTELIESSLIIILIIIFLILKNRQFFKKNGLLFYFLLLFYAIIRFFTDFLKDGFRLFFGLTFGQYFALILIVFMIVVIIKDIGRKKIKN